MKKSTQKSQEELFAEIAEEMGAERVVDLLKDILPSLLHTLMQQGKLDPDKLDDTLYVWTVVRNNEDAVKNLRASWSQVWTLGSAGGEQNLSGVFSVCSSQLLFRDHRRSAGQGMRELWQNPLLAYFLESPRPPDDFSKLRSRLPGMRPLQGNRGSRPAPNLLPVWGNVSGPL